MLTESVLLSITGGTFGVILGVVGVRFLLSLNPGSIPRIGEDGAAVGLDWRVLAFTAIVSVLTGILFGLIPALNISRGDVVSALKENSGRAGRLVSPEQNSFRAGGNGDGVGAGAANRRRLADTHLCCAPACRSWFRLQQCTHDANVANRARFEKAAGVAQLNRDGVQRLDALPGVTEAASTCCVPLEGWFGLPFSVVGRPAWR